MLTHRNIIHHDRLQKDATGHLRYGGTGSVARNNLHTIYKQFINTPPSRQTNTRPLYYHPVSDRHILHVTYNLPTCFHPADKYTFLALDDTAVNRALGGPGEPDPLLRDAALRDQTLLSHLLPQRLYLHDLKDGFTAATLGGQTLQVTVNDGEWRR